MGNISSEKKKLLANVESLARFPSENPNPIMRMSRDQILYANTPGEIVLRTLGVERSSSKYFQDIVSETLESKLSKTIERTVGDQTYSFLFIPIAESGYVNVYGTNISAHKLAEKALEDSERKFRTLTENDPDMIMRFDKNLRISYLNSEIEKVTGIPPKKYIGKTNEEMGMPTDLCQLWNKTFHEASDTRKTQEAEFEFQAPTCKRSYNLRIVPEYDEDGSLISFLSISRDITEQKKAEETLRETSNYLENLFDYANAPIIVWSPDFKITRFNHAFEKMTGYKVEEVIGKNLEILFPEESKEGSSKEIQRTTTGEHWETIEIPILQKNGNTRIALWNSANIYDKDGKTIISTIAQGQDITERKRLEGLREQFVSAVTHELRTPLVSMKGYMEYILSGKMGSMPGKLEQGLGVVKEQTDRLMRLTSDILDYERMTSGRFQFVFHEIDLHKALDASVRDTEASFLSKQQRLRVEIPEENCIVNGDEMRLIQAVSNLLMNASKFTPEHGEITLNAKKDESVIKVFVADTGIGIKHADLTRVFQPFAAIEKSNYIEGTGLGLSVAKSIVEAHGGKIWAESPGPGQGATFTFTLPVNKAGSPTSNQA